MKADAMRFCEWLIGIPMSDLLCDCVNELTVIPLLRELEHASTLKQ